jgi:parallel beta-helix repeat protein
VERISAITEVLSLSILLFGTAGITGVSSDTVEGSLDPAQNQCVEYDSVQKLIQIKCESIHLTDIYNSLRNPAVLGLEGDISENQAKVWILNAGIVVDKESSLIIDSSDTSWLKITATPTIQIKKSANVTEDTNYSDDTLTVIQAASKPNVSKPNSTTKIENESGTITVSKHNGDNPNGIHVHGSLKIDSVKITSWDPEKKDVIRFDFGKRPGEEHTKSDYDTAEPRAFIRVSKDATGTTNITNSEIAYLGYSCSRCAGLSYYGGEGSQIRNSNIHHLLKGFYSKNAAYITIDNNTFHNNYLYGIDPHTGTHDSIISNNLVYNNNASGIICSKHCYNILIEKNEVYKNKNNGIMFSIGMQNSTAKNNYVHDMGSCISFNRESNHNSVYNNTMSNCKTAIDLSNTGNNSIHNNKITDSQSGIVFYNISNKIHNNEISLAKNGIIFKLVSNSNQSSDIASTTSPVPVVNGYESYLTDLVDANNIFDVENPYVHKEREMDTSVKVDLATNDTSITRLSVSP